MLSEFCCDTDKQSAIIHVEEQKEHIEFSPDLERATLWRFWQTILWTQWIIDCWDGDLLWWCLHTRVKSSGNDTSMNILIWKCERCPKETGQTSQKIWVRNMKKYSLNNCNVYHITLLANYLLNIISILVRLELEDNHMEQVRVKITVTLSFWVCL